MSDKPKIVLEFKTSVQLTNFLGEYSDNVLTVLRLTANDYEPREVLKFELPMLAGDEDKPTKWAIFKKGKEIQVTDDDKIWVYYFEGIQ